jgi:CO/xanthine dehydrogenase Mo-binding subunit
LAVRLAAGRIYRFKYPGPGRHEIERARHSAAVKIIWSREESIIGHAKRHAYTIHARWGATKDGKVIAAEHKIMADGGAYNYTSTSVLGNAVVMSTTPYEIPNVNVDGAAYYTNNIPGAAFRGFGGRRQHLPVKCK